MLLDVISLYSEIVHSPYIVIYATRIVGQMLDLDMAVVQVILVHYSVRSLTCYNEDKLGKYFTVSCRPT